MVQIYYRLPVNPMSAIVQCHMGRCPLICWWQHRWTVDVVRCRRSSPRGLSWTMEISWRPVNVWVARKEDKLKIKDECNNYRVCLIYFFNAIRKDLVVGSFQIWYQELKWQYCQLNFFTFYYSGNLWILIIAPIGIHFYFCKHYDETEITRVISIVPEAQ